MQYNLSNHKYAKKNFYMFVHSNHAKCMINAGCKNAIMQKRKKDDLIECYHFGLFYILAIITN